MLKESVLSKVKLVVTDEEVVFFCEAKYSPNTNLFFNGVF
jgi:hypothetical protein